MNYISDVKCVNVLQSDRAMNICLTGVVVVNWNELDVLSLASCRGSVFPGEQAGC
jgi:hypothetical protein